MTNSTISDFSRWVTDSVFGPARERSERGERSEQPRTKRVKGRIGGELAGPIIILTKILLILELFGKSTHKMRKVANYWVSVVEDVS